MFYIILIDMFGLAGWMPLSACLLINNYDDNIFCLIGERLRVPSVLISVLMYS